LALSITTCRRNSGKALVVVEGKSISADDVIKALPASQRANVVMTAVQNELLEKEAVRVGVKVSDEEIDSLVKEQAKRAGGDQQLKDQLAQQGSSLEDLARRLRVQELVLRICTRDVKVTDEQVRKFYDDNPQMFGTAPQYKLAAFQTKTQAEAEAAIARVKAGESFQKVAESAMADPVTSRGAGEANWVDLRSLPAAEAEVVKDLEAHAVSKPLQVAWADGNRWRVYYMEEKKGADVPAFEEVKSRAELATKLNDKSAEDPDSVVRRLLLNYEIRVVGEGLEPVQQMLQTYKTRQTTPEGATIPPGAKAAGPEGAPDTGPPTEGPPSDGAPAGGDAAGAGQ
jgi:foldase protein PrsA